MMSQSQPTVLSRSGTASRKDAWKGRASLSRRCLFYLLTRLRHGGIHVLEKGRRFSFGAVGPGEECPVVQVSDPRFYRQVFWGGSIGAAQAYMKGYWTSDDLTLLVRLFIRNQEVLSDLEGGAARLGGLVRRSYHRVRRNSRLGSRRNISEHYDLGNEFFALFLDPSMTYSCGIFPTPESSMQEASVAKNDLVCRKLRLGPQDHLLEIGSGWGSLALQAAREYGCRVTTATISRNQLEWVTRRVRESGLQDRITVLLKDYRDLAGEYDAVASIEMIEAVGHDFLADYLGCCGRLLKPGRRLVLQGITIADRHYDRYRKSVDFIQRHVFPGSELPSLDRICRLASSRTELELVDLEDITDHYPPTLRFWRERFRANRKPIRELGYPDGLLRMWEFYLCYCEAGFLERHIGDFQLTFLKPREAGAPG